MSAQVVIARTTSTHGGRCQRCFRPILAGEVIVKIDDGRRGVTTRAGNGAGVWICSNCAADDT